MAIRNVTRAGVGLVVGIIILAALVFGGLWLVRERGEQARQEEAINIANEQLEAESNEEVALNPEEENNEESNNGSNGSGSESEGDGETIPQSGTTADEEPSEAEVLPETGPEATAVVAAGILTFAFVAYLRSRKLVNEQL